MSRGGFCDFNILVDRNKKDHLKDLIAVLRAAYKHGYGTVAVNTNIDEEVFSKGTGKGNAAKEIPKPLSIPLMYIIEDYKGTHDKRKFTILQRLTITISDAAHTTKLQTSPAVKEYDILAVKPQNDSVFQMCISTLNVDLICCSMTTRLPLLIKTQHVSVICERGLFLEITYASSWENSLMRRMNITNAKHIVSALKGQNIIVSSEAKLPMDLRGPYDIINLCELFGAKGPLAAQFMIANGRRLVLKSECRKSGMGAVSIFANSWLPEEEAWKTLESKNTDGLTKIVKNRKRRLDEDTDVPKEKSLLQLEDKTANVSTEEGVAKKKRKRIR